MTLTSFSGNPFFCPESKSFTCWKSKTKPSFHQETLNDNTNTLTASSDLFGRLFASLSHFSGGVAASSRFRAPTYLKKSTPTRGANAKYSWTFHQARRRWQEPTSFELLLSSSLSVRSRPETAPVFFLNVDLRLYV